MPNSTMRSGISLIPEAVVKDAFEAIVSKATIRSIVILAQCGAELEYLSMHLRDRNHPVH